MQIVYNNSKVEKIMNDPKKLVKKVGHELALAVIHRIYELKSFEDFASYLKEGGGKPHHLSGNLSKYYAVHLNKNYRLLIEPIENGNDIVICNIVNIEGVVDYHDGKNNWLIP